MCTTDNLLLSCSVQSPDWHLLHDLLSLPISHRCVWSGITGHNLTPEKHDNNYTPHL